MALSTNALCAKAKAMYGNRMQEDEYQELCKKQNIAEVVGYLKTQTNYSDALADISVHNVNRRQVESALGKEYFTRCARLIRYIPKAKQEFYLQEIMNIEVKLIIDKIAHLVANDVSKVAFNVPEYLVKKANFNLYGLINIESYEELLQFLQRTKYYPILVKFNFSASLDLNAIEKQLTLLYYTSYVKAIKKHYKGKVQKQLLDVLYTSIELRNITIMYRLKKYFAYSSETIRNAIISDYSRMSKTMLEELLESKDVDVFLKLLAKSTYRLYVDDDEFVYIEYYVEKIKYNLASRYMRFSNNAPLVYMTYCILQKIEIDNLKHIIEGIRYNKEASSLQEMLIYV